MDGVILYISSMRRFVTAFSFSSVHKFIMLGDWMLGQKTGWMELSEFVFFSFFFSYHGLG